MARRRSLKLLASISRHESGEGACTLDDQKPKTSPARAHAHGTTNCDTALNGFMLLSHRHSRCQVVILFADQHSNVCAACLSAIESPMNHAGRA
eukprot:scaffold374_cov271-Pinguiococcus_pyrenoidosus.AAC.20